jgi:putative ATP-dependent endonuclease of OLD family
MLLRSLQLENFRAVSFARISFDATTVLIGENDCGRSSIMEAIALALGWNCGPAEFSFQPLHVHSPAADSGSPPPRISIALEFCESARGEWNGPGFEVFRARLPAVLTGSRRFWFRVTHGALGTRFLFSSRGAEGVANDAGMLAWLRKRVPVLWMSEGMMAPRRAASLRLGADERDQSLADEVSRNYSDLLQGEALDICGAIEGGASAARDLLLARASLSNDRVTPLGEVLEEITGRRKVSPRQSLAEPLRTSGAAAQKIGLLLLVGALLRAGGANVDRGTRPLTLIDNPEAHLHPMTLASVWGVIDAIEGQKIVATHSGALLARARLSSVRRLTRREGVVREWRVPEGALDADELRRYSYHLRSRRAMASFARCWLLVEGETEFWMMGELARVCGYDFDAEGVVCVEFAQCGLPALIKVAEHLGIAWRLLADGDAAGQQYARSAREAGKSGGATVLHDIDMEHCFWRHGYQHVFRKAAYPNDTTGAAASRRSGSAAAIRRAIERHSKPYLAVLLLDSVMDRGPEGVPPELRNVIESAVRLARRGSVQSAAAVV